MDQAVAHDGPQLAAEVSVSNARRALRGPLGERARELRPRSFHVHEPADVLATVEEGRDDSGHVGGRGVPRWLAPLVDPLVVEEPAVQVDHAESLDESLVKIGWIGAALRKWTSGHLPSASIRGPSRRGSGLSGR